MAGPASNAYRPDGGVPSGTVHQQHGLSARGDVTGYLVEMKLHGRGIGLRQGEGCSGAASRTDGAEQVDVQYMRANWLSNRVFENYEAIVDVACQAWLKLVAQPDTITSIGMRDWAHVG